MEVVATVVRGSRNRAGGGPALTDYGLASRRQAAWWGGPRSSSPLSLSSPRLVLVLVLGLVPSLARASLFSTALLCSPLHSSSSRALFLYSPSFLLQLHTRDRVRVRVHVTDVYPHLAKTRRSDSRKWGYGMNERRNAAKGILVVGGGGGGTKGESLDETRVASRTKQRNRTGRSVLRD